MNKTLVIDTPARGREYITVRGQKADRCVARAMVKLYGPGRGVRFEPDASEKAYMATQYSGSFVGKILDREGNPIEEVVRVAVLRAGDPHPAGRAIPKARARAEREVVA